MQPHGAPSVSGKNATVTFTFRPAVRENVSLWINLIAGTGGGKTFTGMELASGIAGGKPFAVIDTENRRALHYADRFKFEHAELRPPFNPARYAEAVVAADAAGYPVIMIDSGSHVWAGDGGVLDMQENELEDMVKRAASRNDRRPDWQIREAGKMSAWIKPKMEHKQMVQKLLQVKAHIILCLRAEEKIEMAKDDKGKTVIVKKQTLTGRDGWVPICDKNLPFEATASFLLLAANPGVPIPIKLQEQHRALFPLDRPITEESGRRIAEWASGAKANGGHQEPNGAQVGIGTESTPVPGGPRPFITASEAADIETLCLDNKISTKAIAKAAGAEFLTQIPASELKVTHERIDAMVARKGAK